MGRGAQCDLGVYRFQPSPSAEPAIACAIRSCGGFTIRELPHAPGPRSNRERGRAPQRPWSVRPYLAATGVRSGCWVEIRQLAWRGGIWTDARCRRITLEIHPRAAEGESPPPVGEWRVAERGHCTRDEIRIPCVSYDVRTDGDVLLVQTEDLAENLARQFLDGIDVTS